MPFASALRMKEKFNDSRFRSFRGYEVGQVLCFDLNKHSEEVLLTCIDLISSCLINNMYQRDCCRKALCLQGYLEIISGICISQATSLFLSSPVHPQPSLGHLMTNERIFLSVALSGKTSCNIDYDRYVASNFVECKTRPVK